VHHLYSGVILFNKKADESLNLEQEVANIAFGSDQASFWFIATCWEGRVAYFSLPHSQKGHEFLTCKKIQSTHKRDVTCIDITNKNLVVTGSNDNVICFWNSYNCSVNKQIQMPANLLAHSRGSTICALKFAFLTSHEHLLVFMTDGSVYCLNTQNEVF